ncbi:MAG: peptide deformylase [bacterium]|nr:peptide deformylase [bacterium]
MKIITLPNQHLREKSKKISIFTDEVRDLSEKMKAATLEWEDSREHEVGVALAAVQIDVMQKIVIIRVDFNDKKNREFQVFINPEIIKYDGEITEDYEGCLSIKNIYGKVPRYSKVRIKALDENGNIVKVKAEGFLARIFQHEIDHTNGTVFIDHIKSRQDAFYQLDEKGHLEPLDYEKNVKDNVELWPNE